MASYTNNASLQSNCNSVVKLLTLSINHVKVVTLVRRWGSRSIDTLVIATSNAAMSRKPLIINMGGCTFTLDTLTP